ncbi:uncharacterized protein LOC113557463 [Rhopalosiphum maidis]|uniref:uncharacterized protein LOC113557463 n=1 Tax=Rhopalosiphum maidis TaxID=43146 RepID=UPI000EFFF7BF|nr:uncharacterized protein LOC113557463 [Rhopalosiphum maidis]
MSTQEVPVTASTSFSECNISEPTPKQSQQTYQQAINEVKLLKVLTDEEITGLPINRIAESWTDWEQNQPKAEALSELFHCLPSWLHEINDKQEFYPNDILSYIAAQSSKNMGRDIDILVMLGIEKGNNLEKITKILSPKFKYEFIRLKTTYKLVSKAKTSKSAMTLSRICESVPLKTCGYLKNHAKNPVVSFELMEFICKNYPKVMMTSAFAYLIPNKEEEFCQFLKKAHCLHQYEFFARISSQRYPISSHDTKDELISKVYAKTQAAINRSHMKYDVQIKFLKENDLIVQGENEITVTEGVLEAKNLWDEIVRQHEINQINDVDKFGYLSLQLFKSKTCQESIGEVRLLTDEKNTELADKIWVELEKNQPEAEEFNERDRYVPSWLQQTNYEREFDPKVILFYLAASCSIKNEINRIICMLVKLGIENGNNLENIADKLSLKSKREFIRLKTTYNLVSNAKNSKSAVTLSRICESVPLITCWYLKNEAENPIVSFKLMETVCKNFPRVMMTSAFAYLIPNKEDAFCLFLKNAHLLYQYHFFATILHQRHMSSSYDKEDKFISKIYGKTQAAINGSHIKYDIQMQFLKENNLIVEGENEITVTEGVLAANKLWDEKVRKHKINQMYCTFAYEFGSFL